LFQLLVDLHLDNGWKRVAINDWRTHYSLSPERLGFYWRSIENKRVGEASVSSPLSLTHRSTSSVHELSE
jgi:hypothetical protein